MSRRNPFKYFIRDMHNRNEYQINVRDTNLLMKNNKLMPNVSYEITEISKPKKHIDQTMPYQLSINNYNEILFLFFYFAKPLNRPSDNDLENSEHLSFLIKDGRNRIF
jgi:hypothetical protein